VLLTTYPLPSLLSNDLHYNKIKLITNTDLKRKYRILIMSCYNEKFDNCFFELNIQAEKNKITQLSEENSVYVLTHFKNKKKSKQTETVCKKAYLLTSR